MRAWTQALREGGERAPDRSAFLEDGAATSYAAAASRSNGLARALADLGLQRGDRVGLLLARATDRALALFAVAQAGGVAVSINRRLVASQVAHLARDCEMRACIVDRALLGLLAGEALPPLAFVVERAVADAPPCEDGDGAPVVTRYDFDALCAVAGSVDAGGAGDELAAILYTSGSSGPPKGVMLSHANLAALGTGGAEHLALGPADRVLGLLELSNIAGLGQLLSVVASGATHVFRAFSPFDDYAALLRAEAITGLSVTPTHCAAFEVRRADFEIAPFPRLRFVACGGGALPDRTRRLLAGFFAGARIELVYGLTEAMRCASTTPEEVDRSPGYLGRPIGATRMLVVDAAGHPLPPGTEGEIVVCGPQVALGYWRRPAETARAFRPPPDHADGRAHYTGDLGLLDGEGGVTWRGRMDAQIKSAGYRISPTEIEGVLATNPQVAAAAVVGVADDLLGEAVHAFVVPRAGAAVLDVAALRRYCRAELPAYMVPQRISVLDALPTTASGKVDYPALRRAPRS